MKIITGPRGTGKSYQLVLESARTGYPIVCAHIHSLKALEHVASAANVDIPEPVLARDVFEDRYSRLRFNAFLYEDIDEILQNLTGVRTGGMSCFGKVIYLESPMGRAGQQVILGNNGTGKEMP